MAYKGILKSLGNNNAYVVSEFSGYFVERNFAKANKNIIYLFGKTSRMFVL